MTRENQPLVWYALQTTVGREKHTASLLEYRGHETFLPLQKERRRWSDRYKDIELALFPGYLFVRIHSGRNLHNLGLPNTAHVVGTVDDSEIESIRIVISSGARTSPHEFLRSGQTVIINAGPLAGLKGILLYVKTTVRVVVSVALLQRSLCVEVEAEWVCLPDDLRFCSHNEPSPSDHPPHMSGANGLRRLC